jgi:steroid 5-alpha reductase family enzyme
MTDWNSVQQLLIDEFHTKGLLHHTSEWVLHPIASARQADPLIGALWFALAYGIVCYVLGVFTHKYSWVDKSWSILPALYAWYFALSIPLPHHNGSPFDLVAKIQNLAANHPRPLLMAILPTLWAIRLTYNFARKGGYKWNAEDYRWKFVEASWIFQSLPGRIFWQIFAFAFIAMYQNVLLVCFASPAYVAYKDAIVHLNKSQSLTLFDWLLAAAWLFFLAIETIADRQQWDFYIRRDKYRAMSKSEQDSKKQLYGDEIRGFNTRGLFAHSRHPNFFAEQSLWIVYYLFSVATTGEWVNWSVQGMFQLIFFIFLGSTWLTELITSNKYPAYRTYQKYVPRTIPRLTPATILWNDKQE